uniref:Ras-related protein Rab n=1 Tax=Romanomermis culicivorax TaxID=13658 RepID=A0A915HFB3_ROMCU
MNPAAEKNEYLFKILVIGDVGTGKTSIIKRYVHGVFSDHYRATIGVDFAMKILNWNDDSIIRLQLWDIAGQERFGNMTRVYYREASAAIIVFDLTRNSTFDAVQKWKNDLDSKVGLANGEPIPTVLLANKCDFDEKERSVKSETVDDYCQRNSFVGWFETSAKENKGISDAISRLVEHVRYRYGRLLSADGVQNYRVEWMLSARVNYEVPVIERDTDIKRLSRNGGYPPSNSSSSNQQHHRHKKCC